MGLAEEVCALRFSSGEEGILVAIVGDMLTIRSPKSAPPGARLDGTYLLVPPETFRVKVHGCKRVDDKQFQIQGRAIDMSRELRARLGAPRGAP